MSGSGDTPLDEAQIREALTGLAGWDYDPSVPALVLEHAAPSFPAGIEWVRAVAEEAERRGHHPDIDIRWRTVTFRCSTHSDGAVTGKDVALAGVIDRLAPR